MTGLPASDPGWGRLCLRRHGAQPLVFDGRLKVAFSGAAPALTRWYHLALYDVQPTAFVAELVFWHTAPQLAPAAGPAMCHAFLCRDVIEACERFERHNPLHDLCPGVSAPDVAMHDRDLSVASLLQQALSLRLACADTIYQYKLACGQLLSKLYAV